MSMTAIDIFAWIVFIVIIVSIEPPTRGFSVLDVRAL